MNWLKNIIQHISNLRKIVKLIIKEIMHYNSVLQNCLYPKIYLILNTFAYHMT